MKLPPQPFGPEWVAAIDRNRDRDNHAREGRWQRIEELRKLEANMRDAGSSFEQSTFEATEQKAEGLLDGLLSKSANDVSKPEWDEFHDAMDALRTSQDEQKKFSTAKEKYQSAKNKLLGRAT